jgi:glucose/arabinose dehydrogenase
LKTNLMRAFILLLCVVFLFGCVREDSSDGDDKRAAETDDASPDDVTDDVSGDDQSDDDALDDDHFDDDSVSGDDTIADDATDDNVDDTTDDDIADDDITDDADDDTVPQVCLTGDLPLEEITLPAGFQICFFASVPGARQMALGGQGTLFVGTHEDRFYAITDENGDGVSDVVRTIDEGLNAPNGVAFRNGDLYVAEIPRVIRYDDIEQNLDSPPEPVVVNDDFPTESHHAWKFIGFGPDNKLYVPVGSPCNVCEVEDPFGTIMRLNQDGGNLEVFARGIRNSVGFAWRPGTTELWFTDNGRDNMGDDIPYDELNLASAAGLHFGFPYCHQGNITDPVFGDAAHPCDDYEAPVLNVGPHVAALGMRFYTGDMFPAEYQGNIFIAQHGSWNRTVPIGCRIMRVSLNGPDVASSDIFAEGWLDVAIDDRWGRPVDVQVAPDGGLYISDDLAGVIYKVVYNE